jgi:diguanylate cyclase (GGDEF)-like protein
MRTPETVNNLMISLRKSLSKLDELTGLYHACLDSYLAALGDMEKHVVEVEQEEAARHRQALRQIRTGLDSETDARSLQAAKAALESELRRYGQQARQAIRRKETDVREILAMLAKATAAMTDQNDRHTADFRGLATELEAVSELETLSQIRQRLAHGVRRLKECVDSMVQENRASVDRLQDELKVFRRRLEQAEAAASTDALTGLANRREAEKTIRLRIDAGRSVCIMLFDLNGFKNINDRHGHTVGDQVLKAFAQRLSAQYRSGDVVCRWGGDEFLAILAGTPPDAVGRAAAVASGVHGPYQVQTERGTLSVDVSASVGVAQHQPGETGADLFARADALLYQSRGVALAPLPSCRPDADDRLLKRRSG